MSKLLRLKPIRSLKTLWLNQKAAPDALLSQSLKAQTIIAHVTVELNPQMVMGWAIQLWEYGLIDKYLDDLRFREMYDLWCRSSYADLDFDEFLIKCGIPYSELTAAQTATAASATL